MDDELRQTNRPANTNDAAGRLIVEEFAQKLIQQTIADVLEQHFYATEQTADEIVREALASAADVDTLPPQTRDDSTADVQNPPANQKDEQSQLTIVDLEPKQRLVEHSSGDTSSDIIQGGGGGKLEEQEEDDDDDDVTLHESDLDGQQLARSCSPASTNQSESDKKNTGETDSYKTLSDCANLMLDPAIDQSTVAIGSFTLTGLRQGTVSPLSPCSPAHSVSPSTTASLRQQDEVVDELDYLLDDRLEMDDVD